MRNDAAAWAASRVAVGTPTDFGSEAYREFIREGGFDGNELKKRTLANDPAPQNGSLTAVLGVDVPMFVEAPDAVSYEYEITQGGYEFKSLTIDPYVGGNALLPAAFDLYLKTGGEWQFAGLINQIGENGLIEHEFAQPVSQFRLYGLPLVDTVLHDEDNAQRPDLVTTTGLILTGGTGVPRIRMTEVDARNPFTEVDPFEVDTPVFASTTSIVRSNFEITRDGADAVILVNGASPQVDSRLQMAAVRDVTFVGHDNVEDTLIIHGTGGPLRAPIEFRGGFRKDSILVRGSDIDIDLTGETFRISEVELIDIRGMGSNSIRFDADTIIESNPFSKSLTILRQSDDSVHPIDQPGHDGWTLTGVQFTVHGNLNRYEKDGATLYTTRVFQFLVSEDASTHLATDTGETGDGSIPTPEPVRPMLTLPVAQKRETSSSRPTMGEDVTRFETATSEPIQNEEEEAPWWQQEQNDADDIVESLDTSMDAAFLSFGDLAEELGTL